MGRAALWKVVSGDMKESKWGTKLIDVHESIPNISILTLTVRSRRGTVEGVSGSQTDSHHFHVSRYDRNIACEVEGSKPFLVKRSRGPVDEVEEVPTN